MSRFLLRVLASSSIALACTLCLQPIVRPARATAPSGYVQVWSDEFSGTALDTTKWGYRLLDQQWREAIHKREAVKVDSGQLVITTYTINGQHYTGWLQTGAGFDEVDPDPINKYVPHYGYYEARIDFDGSSGMWNTFVLQTPSNLQAGPMNPRDRGVEIDVVEHRVINQFGTDISATAPSALHWLTYNSPVYPNTADVRSAGGEQRSGDSDLSSGFHTYGLEWMPDTMKIYYDSQLVWTILNSSLTDPPAPDSCAYPPCSPPNTDYPSCFAPVPRDSEYIILSSEVIDSSWCGMYPPNGFGSLANSTTKMKVDYVRHYQRLVAPSGLTATAGPAGVIDLSWAEIMYAETGFKIERSLNGTSFSEIATVGADVHTYHDSGLNPGTAGTRFYYRVRAYYGTINGAYSNTANAIADDSAPSAVTDLSIPSIGKLNIAVSWTAPGDACSNGAITQYDLRRSTSAITSGNFASATQVSTGIHVSGFPECKVISSLSACTTYYFAIKSKDAAGNWSAISNVPNGKTICVANAVAECDPPENDGVAPATVSDLSVTSPGNTTLAVSWTTPGDDGTSGTAQEYDLRYSTSSINSSNFNSATRFMTCKPEAAGYAACEVVSGLTASTTYYFALKTRDEWGWSAISNVPSDQTVSNNWVAECDLGMTLQPPSDDASQSAATAEGTLSFSAPRPNPARGTMNFEISIPGSLRGAQLRVGVFDLAGRRVRSLADRNAVPGPAQIEWNLIGDSGQRVTPAMYMVRVDIGHTRKIFPFVVLR
jgi:hypothetical protein